jgi:hypothetical protein
MDFIENIYNIYKICSYIIEEFTIDSVKILDEYGGL